MSVCGWANARKRGGTNKDVPRRIPCPAHAWYVTAAKWHFLKRANFLSLARLWRTRSRSTSPRCGVPCFSLLLYHSNTRVRTYARQAGRPASVLPAHGPSALRRAPCVGRPFAPVSSPAAERRPLGRRVRGDSLWTSHRMRRVIKDAPFVP